MSKEKIIGNRQKTEGGLNPKNGRMVYSSEIVEAVGNKVRIEHINYDIQFYTHDARENAIKTGESMPTYAEITALAEFWASRWTEIGEEVPVYISRFL